MTDNSQDNQDKPEEKQTSLVKQVLDLAGLNRRESQASSLNAAVAANHPALGDLFPQYVRDDDNLSGAGEIIIRNGQIVDKPENLSEAQVKTLELLRRFCPVGEMKLTQRQVASVLQQLRNETQQFGCGASTIPMTCTGAFCPMVRDTVGMQAMENGEQILMEQRDLSRCKCTLYEVGANPIGKPCPLEILRDVTLRSSLYDALEIAPDESAIHVHLISNLVSWIVLQQRVMLQLGIEPDLIVESTTNIVEVAGEAIACKRKEVNPLMSAMDLCQRNIDNLRKQLMATPEMQFKLRQRTGNEQQGAPVVSAITKRSRKELQRTLTVDNSALVSNAEEVK